MLHQHRWGSEGAPQGLCLGLRRGGEGALLAFALHCFVCEVSDSMPLALCCLCKQLTD